MWRRALLAQHAAAPPPPRPSPPPYKPRHKDRTPPHTHFYSRALLQATNLEEDVRVPLFVAGPGVAEGAVSAYQVGGQARACVHAAGSAWCGGGRAVVLRRRSHA